MKFRISVATPTQRLAHYEKLKQGGIWRFVVLHGVLGWGLSCGVVMSMLALVGALPLPDQRFVFLLVVIGAFMAGGFLWGLGIWFFTMRQYSRAKRLS